MLVLTEHAHALVREVLLPGDWAVDATVGNGHDTAMLADAVGPSGHVIGFDIQEAALARARVRLIGRPNVALHCRGHEHLAATLPGDAQQRLAAVMFNLGYLPGANKATTTRPDTTLAALRQAGDHLAVGGRITVMLYTGHPTGIDEADAVRAFARALPATLVATHFARLNAPGPAPELILIERTS